MNVVRISIYALCALFVFGCSHQPPALVEMQEPQRKLLAAKHWRALAERAVHELVCRSESQKSTCLTDRSYYVASTAPDMAFSKAFRNYLTNRLLENGVAVSNSPLGADVIRFDVQRFLYDNLGNRHPFHTATYRTTAFAADLAFGAIWPPLPVGIAAIAAAGPIHDYLVASSRTTNAEVVITVIVERLGTLADAYTEEFYVQAREIGPNGVFWTSFPTTHGPTTTVSGPPPPRSIRVANE